MMTRFELAALASLVIGCKGSTVPSTPDSGGASSTVTGKWSGVQGASQNRLSTAVRIELVEGDGGSISGIINVEDPPDSGSYASVGILTGYRDGGVFNLVEGAVLLPDGGAGGGYPFTGTFTSTNHLEAIEMGTKSDGGPLPIYFKLDLQ